MHARGGMTDEKRYSGPERRDAARSWVQGALDPLFGLLRWLRDHVRDFYVALGLYLLVGFSVIALAAIGFAALAEAMAEGETQRVDEQILLWLNSHANPTLDAAALEITALGGFAAVWMVLLVASVFLWTTRHRFSVLLLWAAYGGGSLINFMLKAGFERPRPDLFPWRTPYAGNSSFPSGHSMTAAVVYATLAYLVARLEPSRALRRVTLAVAAAVILAVGGSRLYLGVHYPSDVLGGFIVGIAWASFCALGIEAVRFFRGKSPDADRHEQDLDRGTAPLRDAMQTHPEEAAERPHG